MNAPELSKLEIELKDRDVVVLNTNKDPVMFALAHLIRNYARTTFCVDPTYKISEEQQGFRKIEEGRVYLIRGSLDNGYGETIRVYNLIRELGGQPSRVFNSWKVNG